MVPSFAIGGRFWRTLDMPAHSFSNIQLWTISRSTNRAKLKRANWRRRCNKAKAQRARMTSLQSYSMHLVGLLMLGNYRFSMRASSKAFCREFEWKSSPSRWRKLTSRFCCCRGGCLELLKVALETACAVFGHLCSQSLTVCGPSVHFGCRNLQLGARLEQPRVSFS